MVHVRSRRLNFTNRARRLALNLPVVVLGGMALVPLAGCPAGGSSPAAGARRMTGAPAVWSYAAGAPIPGYESVRPDQTLVYTLPFNSKRIDVVKTRTATELTIERRTLLGGEAQEPREVHLPLVSSGEPFLPDGVDLRHSFTKIAEDKLTVSGQDFDCDVYEAKGGQQTVRYWIAARFPFVIRSTANESETLALKQFLDHPPTSDVKELPPVMLNDAPPTPASSPAAGK